MTDAADPPPKPSKLPLIAGLVLMLALGGGGFYAVYSGLLLGGDADMGDAETPVTSVSPLDPTEFIALDPILVSLARSAPNQQLRFEGHLEVHPDHAAEVARLMPRIMDVLNSYLRAMDAGDLRDPAALVRLRAQMLRRIQVVTGEGRVRDLLVSTFLLT